MKKILIAADSFKDALPASEVCKALERGIQAARPDLQTRCFPLADGGEGSFEVLAAHLGLKSVEMDACDPLGRPIRAVYGRSADGTTACIEMAQTAGIQLLLPEERNPLKTTTFGTGLQIAHAWKNGARRIILAIGGSATNDAGMGMAAALGWQFLDKNGAALAPIGAHLDKVHRIVSPPGKWEMDVQVICDVTNPLFGPQGAAYVYARQKGADDAAILALDTGLQHFYGIINQSASISGMPTLAAHPGAGAAGGMGYGAMVFLHATLRRGIDLVLELTKFDQQLTWADLIVTGEGKIDAQTASGKLVQGICQHAAAQQIPVVAFCGKLEATTADIEAIGLQAARSINGPDDSDLAEMLRKTAQNLENAAAAYFGGIV